MCVWGGGVGITVQKYLSAFIYKLRTSLPLLICICTVTVQGPEKKDEAIKYSKSVLCIQEIQIPLKMLLLELRLASCYMT